MNEHEFNALEAQLAGRRAQQPADELRGRVLDRIEGARRRERSVRIGATLTAGLCLAVAAVVMLTSPTPEPAELRRGSAQLSAELAAALGLDDADARRGPWLLADARLPRIAPPLGSTNPSLGALR